MNRILKRSKEITLTILVAIAAAACKDDMDSKHCVDENGVVQDDSNCTNSPETLDGEAPMQSDGDGGLIPRHAGGGHFFWYYGGMRTASPGTRISGGSYTPSPGRSYSAPSISKGGFGSFGSSHGSSGS